MSDDRPLKLVALAEDESAEVGPLIDRVRAVGAVALGFAEAVQPVEERIVQHVVARRRGRHPIVPLLGRLRDGRSARKLRCEGV